MNTQTARHFNLGHQLSLLDTVIIILTACSIVIFVFTIGAKFLKQDTFDKLPEFLKNSYSALWSAGVVAGGALAGSVVDALSKRESTKGSFILYIMATTLMIMVLIIGTVELSRSIEGPRFTVPPGATALSVTSNTSKPVSFYLQNRMNAGNPGRIRGTYQIKDGELTGDVVDSELEPLIGVTPSAVPLTSISVHVCYYAVQNGVPVFAFVPQFPVDSDREAISAMTNMQQPFQIPKFKFQIDVKHLDYIAPPYLCAFVDGQSNYHLSYY